MSQPASTTEPLCAEPNRLSVRLPGVAATILSHSQVRELHMTFRPDGYQSVEKLACQLDSLLREHDATVVRHEVFGSLADYDDAVNRLRNSRNGNAWPITWIEDPAAESGISGMHVLAVAGKEVEPITIDGRPVGCVYEDAEMRHCVLGGLGPFDPTASRESQVFETLLSLETALDRSRMTLANLARTWFFIDDILGWYSRFNAVRTDFYRERGVFQRVVPASTGIGAGNCSCTALTAGAWAVELNSKDSSVRELISPLQCSASKYGSSFSRAVEIRSPTNRRVFVSGTAAIGPSGVTEHAGDIQGQIDLTMRAVEAILSAEQLDFNQVTRATVFFKEPNQLACFADWCERHNLPQLPFAALQATICRPGLLFEIELDAIELTGLSSK